MRWIDVLFWVKQEVCCLRMSQRVTWAFHTCPMMASHCCHRLALNWGKWSELHAKERVLWFGVIFNGDSPSIRILISVVFNPRPFLLLKLVFLEIKLRFDYFCSLPPHALSSWPLCTPFLLGPVFPIGLKLSCLSSSRLCSFFIVGMNVMEVIFRKLFLLYHHASWGIF